MSEKDLLLFLLVFLNCLLGAYLSILIWCINSKFLHLSILLRDIRSNSESCRSALFFLAKKVNQTTEESEHDEK